MHPVLRLTSYVTPHPRPCRPLVGTPTEGEALGSRDNMHNDLIKAEQTTYIYM